MRSGTGRPPLGLLYDNERYVKRLPWRDMAHCLSLRTKGNSRSRKDLWPLPLTGNTADAAKENELEEDEADEFD